MKQNILWRALLVALVVGLSQGCRQMEKLPDAKPDTVPTEILHNIQNWYNPKIERLRAQKSGTTDIYLPQWGEGKLQILPTGERIAFFPAHRDKAVEYHAVGFVRRFAVKLSPTNEVIGAKLIETIGDKEYLRTHKDEAIQRHLLGTAKGMPIVVMESAVPLEGMRGKFGPDCGLMFVELVSGVIRVYNGCGRHTDYPLTGEGGGGSWWQDPNVSSGGSSQYYNGSWYGNNPPQEYFGGGSGGTSGGSTAPVIPVFNICPNIGLTSSPCPSTDKGDNTPPPTDQLPAGELPAEVDVHFREILVNNTLHHYTTYSHLMSLNQAFKQSYDKSCIVQQAIAKIKASGIPVKLSTKSDMGDATINGVKYIFGGRMERTIYYEGTQEKQAIGVLISSRHFGCFVCNEIIHKDLNSYLFEELFHGLQSTVYPEFATMAQVNKEFEAKFLIDLANYLQDGEAFGMVFQAFDGNENRAYEAWLNEITEKRTKVPTHAKIMEKYNQMRELFRSQYPANHPYGGQPSAHEPLMMKQVLDAVRATPNCK